MRVWERERERQTDRQTDRQRDIERGVYEVGGGGGGGGGQWQGLKKVENLSLLVLAELFLHKTDLKHNCFMLLSHLVHKDKPTQSCLHMKKSLQSKVAIFFFSVDPQSQCNRQVWQLARSKASYNAEGPEACPSWHSAFTGFIYTQSNLPTDSSKMPWCSQSSSEWTEVLAESMLNKCKSYTNHHLQGFFSHHYCSKPISHQKSKQQNFTCLPVKKNKSLWECLAVWDSKNSPQLLMNFLANHSKE